jgi:hypothetical protein
LPAPNVDYIVVLDVNSPVGMFMLTLRGKIGGATNVMALPTAAHPCIIARDLDWAKLPAFVRMTQLQDPLAEDRKPRELVVPAAAVLAVIPDEPPASQQPPEQQKPAAPLH